MSAVTMAEVVRYAARCGFEVIDVTGGAPELLPGLPGFLNKLKPHCRKLMLRTNLTAFTAGGVVELAKTCIVIFLASYLREHRELLVVGARRVMGIPLPPLKHLGPRRW